MKETSAFGHCSKQQDVDNDEIPDVCDNCKSLANQTDVNTNALSEERERATFPTLETLGDDCDPVPVVRVAKQTATPIVQGLAPPPSVFLPGDRWLGEQSQFEPPATFGGLRVGYRHCDCFDQASGEALPLEQCVGALKQCPWDDPTNDSANWRRPSITSLVTGTPVMDASGLSTPLTFERGAAINYPASWSWCDDLGSGQVMGQGSCFPSTENGSTHGAIATVVSGAPVSIRDTGKNLRDTFKLYTTPLVDEYTPQILDVQSCSIIPCLSWFNPNIYINPWEGLDFGNQFVAPVLLDGAPGSIQVNPGGTQSFDVTAKISSGTGALIADPTALWLSPAEASYRLRQKHAAARVQAVAMPKDLAPGIAVELVLATPGGLVTERERPDVPAIAAAAASALPTSRRDIQAVFSGTEQAVYVVGGVDDEGEADQSIARYGLDNRSWETLRADVRFVPSAVVFAVTYDALRSQLYVLDLDDEPILPKLRQVRLIRIDVQTGDSALLAKWPRVGLFEQLRLAALDDGSLALIGARAHVYNVWRVVPHGDGIEYGGHFLGLGTLLGQPVMGEEHLVLAVKRNKTLEYVTLSPDRFHGKGQCGAL